jgi:hypothetical protein
MPSKFNTELAVRKFAPGYRRDAIMHSLDNDMAFM